MRILALGMLIAMLAACGETDEDRERRAQDALRDELEALEKAQQLEEDLQKAVDEQQKEIEEQITGG